MNIIKKYSKYVDSIYKLHENLKGKVFIALIIIFYYIRTKSWLISMIPISDKFNTFMALIYLQ
jgi:hypothetical protein